MPRDGRPSCAREDRHPRASSCERRLVNLVSLDGYTNRKTSRPTTIGAHDGQGSGVAGRGPAAVGPALARRQEAHLVRVDPRGALGARARRGVGDGRWRPRAGRPARARGMRRADAQSPGAGHRTRAPASARVSRRVLGVVLPGVHRGGAARGGVPREGRDVQRVQTPRVAHGAVVGARRHRRAGRRDVLHQGGRVDRRFLQRAGDEPARALPLRPRRRLPIGARPDLPVGARRHGRRIAKHGVGRGDVRGGMHRLQRASADAADPSRALRRHAREGEDRSARQVR
mmetsp:Transcript_11375/g.47619  ORF Transcript_11375/g.47619 Transcript_11375/m.47619 type:complete len:286 (+) Transcript_11375:927-1784(+)